MTLYGWQAAGVVAIIGLVAAVVVAALWGWFQLSEHFEWPALIQLGAPCLTILVAAAIYVAIVGVRV